MYLNNNSVKEPISEKPFVRCAVNASSVSLEYENQNGHKDDFHIMHKII